MLGVAVGMQPQYSARRLVPFPEGFAKDQGRFGFDIAQLGEQFKADLDPRGLIDPAVWSGPAFHVDVSGDDSRVRTAISATPNARSMAHLSLGMPWARPTVCW